MQCNSARCAAFNPERFEQIITLRALTSFGDHVRVTKLFSPLCGACVIDELTFFLKGYSMPSKISGPGRKNALFLMIFRDQTSRKKADAGIRNSSSKAVDKASRVNWGVGNSR